MNSPMDAKERLILALNVNSLPEAKDWVLQLKDYIGYFKVGKDLFISSGSDIIEEIKKENCKVFLDLKFHDIPSVVKKACLNASTLGIDMMTIHSLGGYTMMKESVDGLKEWSDKNSIKKPIILAVTILTSMAEQDLNDIGVNGRVEDTVLRLAELAKKAGVDGVVASAKEAKFIKSKFGNELLVITPGIRIGEVSEEDQKRYMRPREAIEAGADYLVIGRPILKSSEPIGTVKSILSEIKESFLNT